MDRTQQEVWPYDPRSDQVSLERQRDQLRVQEDIQEAWDRLMRSAHTGLDIASEEDIKLLRWALGVK